MSIATQITRIAKNVSDSLDAVAAKGVVVPAGSTSDDLPSLIAQITSGSGSVISITDELDSHGGTIRHINAVSLLGDTVSPASLLQGYTAHNSLGQAITGTYVPSGTPTLGTKTITANGTYYASDDSLDGYSSITVNVANGMSVVETTDPGGGTIVTVTGQEFVLQSKTVTPTTSQQIISPDNGYAGLQTVTVNAIPSQYIIPTGTKSITQNGTGIDVTNYAAVNVAVPDSTFAVNLEYNENTDMWEPDQTIADIQTAYLAGRRILVVGPDQSDYSAGGYFDIYAGLLVYWIVVEQYVPIAAEVRTTYEYNYSGIEIVSQETYIIPSGTKSITQNGTGIDVTNYASVNVNVSGGGSNLQAKTNITPTESSQTITPDAGYDGLSSVQINGISSTYVGSDITRRSSTDLTASGATVTVPSGYYSSQATKSVSSMTLPTATSGSATSGYTSKATISRSTADQYINIPTGYNNAGAYYKINAVANGSATGPSSLSGTSATISTGTNTLTLTKTGVTTTPTVSAGYIASATASSATVTLTASVTTKAAATITPGTTNQTIASGTYLTGTQTISGDANLVGSNIISGKSIFGVSGTVVIQHYYTGSSAPSSSLGVNGDIYLQTS